MKAVYIKLGEETGRENVEPEVLARKISEICCVQAIDLVIFEETSYTRELAARVSVHMDAACLPEVAEVLEQGNKRYFVRETYQANIYADYLDQGRPLVITFKKEGKEAKKDTFLICGYGVGSKKNAEEIVRIAGKYGFGVGATRPVVTAGWLPYEYLVGISGAWISPKNCIVLGASGSQAFMAGIKDSGTIIAVNTDQSAPVFQKCDKGIIGDCMEFVRNLAGE